MAPTEGRGVGRRRTGMAGTERTTENGKGVSVAYRVDPAVYLGRLAPGGAVRTGLLLWD